MNPNLVSYIKLNELPVLGSAGVFGVVLQDVGLGLLVQFDYVGCLSLGFSAVLRGTVPHWGQIDRG